MTRIGLISDTHGYLDNRLFEYFKNCDEIWHAGDIGAMDISVRLQQFKPLKAVYGNIDGQDIRAIYPGNHRFLCEELDVWITHTGGYPDNYDRSVRKEIMKNKEDNVKKRIWYQPTQFLIELTNSLEGKYYGIKGFGKGARQIVLTEALATIPSYKKRHLL